MRTSQAILLLGLFLFPLIALYPAEKWPGLTGRERKRRLIVLDQEKLFRVAFPHFHDQGKMPLKQKHSSM